jgi:hypothetical protein
MLEQRRDRVLRSGLLTEEELAGYLRLDDDPSFFSTGEAVTAAWGQRPRSA